MTESRFHHLSLCVLCIVLCQVIALQYRSFTDWRWHAALIIGAYAAQPLLNICLAPIRARWRRKSENPYQLLEEPTP